MALKWTQSKLTKAIGLASVVGAASALSPAAQALKTDFGVEYRATGFYAQSGAFDVAGDPRNDNDNGFAHLIRVKSDFLDEDTGISLHTSVELAGDRWSGDARNYTTAPPSGAPSHGYVQIPFGHTVVRVGRQATSYSNCFLVCDDRRDRVLLIQPFSKTFQVLAIYDRRRDLDTFENTDNGDQFIFGFVSKPMGLDISALYIKYLKNYEGDIAQATNSSGPYAVSGADLFSGYISGNIGEVAKATVGANYFTNGKVTTPANNGQFVTEDALSQYIRLEGSVGVMDWGVQYVGAQDGGYISPGFDTYSSLIQNNPESTANPTSLYTMAQSYGVEGYDESVLAGKLTWNVTPKLAITGAVGQLDIDNPAPPGGNNSVSDESTFYDLQLSYQVNKTLRTWVTYGILEENEAGALSGNTLLGALPSADFSQDDVQAASVNLAVSF